MTTTNVNEGGLQGQKNAIKAGFELNRNGETSTILIRKSRVVVGSVETADLKLNSAEGVSPIHAVIEIEFGADVSTCKAKILDLASGTGVFVNGQRIVHGDLSAGDEVRIGSVSFRFGFQKPQPREALPDQALLLIDAGTVEPIFDYRPEVKDTLEAVYSWNDAILDVDHLATEQTLVIPPVYQNGVEVNLANKVGAYWSLVLTAGMKGMVYMNGESQTVEALRQSGKSVQIGPNDFAKIESGPISVYLSQTVAPPVLKRTTRLVTDPFFAKTLGLSFLFSAVALVALSLLPADLIVQDPEQKPLLPPEVKITLTKEQMKKFTVKAGNTLVKPEPKPQEVAKKEPGGAQGKKEGKTGEGARKIGPEGGGKKASGDTSKTASSSLLKAISNPNLRTNTLLAGGGSGGTSNGRGSFDTKQNNGAFLTGPGSGGGGNSASGGGTGLRDRGGRGDKGVGTGIGNATGNGTPPGDIVIKPSTGGGYLVYGSINREAIEEAILSRRDEFISCYQSEFGSGKAIASGKVMVAFVIGKKGWASEAAIKSSSLNNLIVERCIVAVMKRIPFPEPDGGQPVSVTYPFNFANASK